MNLDHWKSNIQHYEKQIKLARKTILDHEREIRKKRRSIESFLRLIGQFRLRLTLEKRRQWQKALGSWKRPKL